MKPVCRAGLTSRARIYRRAVHKHLLTKTRHLFNTSFPLVLYRERRILRTDTGMAEARKSPFRMAEKPLWRRWKRTLIMSDNISYCVSAEYVKRPKAAYLQPKACLRAKTAVFSRCDVYLYMRPCIFMHASMYIYSCFHVYLFIHQYIFARIHAADGTACGGFSSVSRQHERRRSTDSPL